MNEPHPDRNSLARFIEGLIDDEDSVLAIESHLSRCNSCQTVAAELNPCDLETTIKELYQSNGWESSSVSDYAIGEELGRGGAGVVYRATQPRLNRDVALKMLSNGDRILGSELARFRRECSALSQLNHPNIVSVFDCGEQNGQPYIAMELIEGTTLDKSIARELPTAFQTAQLMVDLTDAVDHAHQNGIVHRDLKPQNILIANGEARSQQRYDVKIADFGLSHLLDDQYTTKTGQIIGTPSYMAPEIARSSPNPDGHRIDIYGLGAVMYQCLTGRAPFIGEQQITILRDVIDKDPVSISILRGDVPVDLATICLRCLDKNPDKRFGTAADLKQDLMLFLDGKPIRSRRTSLPEKMFKWSRRNIWKSVALATSISLLALLVFGLIWNQASISHERDIAQQNYESARRTIMNMLAATDQKSVMEIAQLRDLSSKQTSEAILLYERLAKIENTTESKRDLATIKMRAGTIKIAGGEYDQGVEILQSAAASLQQLLENSPENADISRDLIGSQIKLAAAFAGQNRNDDAIALLRPLIPIAKSLNTNPNDVQQINLITWLLHNLGNAANGKKDHALAATFYEQECEWLEKARKADPNNLELFRLTNDAEICLAVCYMLLQRPNEALAAFDNSIESLTKLQQDKTSDTNIRISIAIAYLNKSNILAGMSKANEAVQACTYGIEQLTPIVKSDPENFSACTQLAMLHGNRAMYNEDVDAQIEDWICATTTTPDKDTRDYCRTMLYRLLMEADNVAVFNWLLPISATKNLSAINRFRQIALIGQICNRIKNHSPSESDRLNMIVEKELIFLKDSGYFGENPAATEHVQTSDDFAVFRANNANDQLTSLAKEN